MSGLALHLLPNAHLDPVWLWDWREGLNEAVTTTDCMLGLMDEFEDFTFIRGEAALYSHIEESFPETFERLARRIEEGRWDVVGGTWVQPDTNLPSTETFCRHFAAAQSYFMSRFGLRAKAAWATDSFGHSAGLPEILEAAGMEFFAFSRPQPEILPIEKPAFWWIGQGGARILSYRIPSGWYGSDRDEIGRRLDRFLADAPKWGLDNLAVFYGLGDHGGGATRRQLKDMASWASKHPEVKVFHSTLHGYFDALKKELKRKGEAFIPEHKGELNFTLRGCYSSAAKIKFPFRKLEASVRRAEALDTAASALLDAQPECLCNEWEAVLFNSFHDILPGSSIERACEEQASWMQGAMSSCQRTEFDALNELARKIDVSVGTPKGDRPSGVPMIVFNPHPFEYDGPLELEASLDYRPISEYKDKPSELPWELLGHDRKPLPFQEIHTEHNFCQHVPWRKRAVVNAKVPPMGWTVFEMRWRDGAVNSASKAASEASSSPKDGVIRNAFFKVEAKPGDKGIRIFRDGKPLFSGDGFGVATCEDPFGSWGGHYGEKEADDVSAVRQIWTVDKVKVLESGPLRATLWVRMKAGGSWLELAVSLSQGRPAADFSARLLLNERAARVKLLMPSCDGKAEYEVPGGSVLRDFAGEVPGGRWVKVFNGARSFSFASDALYNFDARKGLFGATVARTSYYSCDAKRGPDEAPELPVTDCGEYKFKFLLGPCNESAERLSATLEMPPLVQTVPPCKGGRHGRRASLLEIKGGSLKLLAMKPALDGKGMIVRVQECSGKKTEVKVVLFGKALSLGEIGPFKIASWRVKRHKGGYKTFRVDCAEFPV